MPLQRPMAPKLPSDVRWFALKQAEARAPTLQRPVPNLALMSCNTTDHEKTEVRTLNVNPSTA